jgi:hypothetical protein
MYTEILQSQEACCDVVLPQIIMYVYMLEDLVLPHSVGISLHHSHPSPVHIRM